MFITRALNFAATGKGPELRSVLEERVKTDNSRGGEVSLGTLVYSDDGPAFVVTARYQNLAALDAGRTRNQADQARVASLAKSAALSRQPAKVSLAEVLIGPTQGVAALHAPYYLVRTTSYPAMGKAAELRALLMERVQKAQAAKERTTLSTTVFSGDGGAFFISRAFADLAAYDTYRQHLQSDSAYQLFGAKAVSLSRQPAGNELAQVLIPFPAR
jgi:hypothetical protein